MQRRIVPHLFLAILLLGSAARAERVLDHYDLDSLAYLSTAIVRAEVGESKPFKTEDGNFIEYTVTVRDVLKGPIKPGESVPVTGLDEFQRAPGMPGHADSWDPIHKGDVVYLFLVPNDDRVGYAMYRFADAKWQVIESGARLLDGKTVYDFIQFFDGLPQPPPHRTVYCGFAAMTTITSPGSSTMTQHDFEDRLKATDKAIAQFNQLLAAPASPPVGDRIAAFLRDRAALMKKERSNSDALGSKLAIRLASMSTPVTVLDLMDGSPEDTRAQLRYLLESNFGRDYLLATVGDPKVSSQRRNECAEILSDAGVKCDREGGK